VKQSSWRIAIEVSRGWGWGIMFSVWDLAVVDEI
jgi:hypothetical protein